MFARPKNRRKPSEARPRLPLINWRYLGLWVGALAGIAAAVCVASWAFDQPIETVAVAGRFQRVAPVDVERVVKEKVYGARLAPRPERAGHRADRRGALGRARPPQHPWRAVRLRRAPHSAGAGAARRPRRQGVTGGAALSGRRRTPVAGGAAPH